MVDAFLVWLFNLQVLGLPIFASDRADLYLLATNDTPWTVQFVGVAPASGTDGDLDNPNFEAFAFNGPSAALSLQTASPDGGYRGVAIVVSPDGTAVHSVGFSNQPPLFIPYGFAGQEQPVFYQLEWIDPSLKRLVAHAIVGFIFGFALDLVVSSSWGVVVAFTRLGF